ncbi:hypothetical protein JB92DRAFT_3149850 [Gautieria morchelliformis]|nr:hypothetical protein JB92DRAFT_3149850 [Gautieria morchelliformis]
MFLSDDVMGLPAATSARRQRAALSIAGGRQSVFQAVLAAHMDALENEVYSLKCSVREDTISVSSEDHDDRVRTMSTRKVLRQENEGTEGQGTLRWNSIRVDVSQD